MKITILSPGKWRKSPELELFNQYVKRINWSVELIELDEKKEKQICDYIPPSSYKIVLDECGKKFTSKELAKKIEKLQVQGTSKITFLIGGADGHLESTLEQADLILSLGDMTWPHMLVRAMLAEQIYRCYSILSGHPYHRE